MIGRRVLIVGGGAREHALGWKLRQSPDVQELWVAPGNAGTACIAQNIPVPATDISGIERAVRELRVDLTVVGPEAPLALGLADVLKAAGRRIVGPGVAAARIESSKAFAKTLMERAGVPTARHSIFHDRESALRAVRSADYPLVVKADGLAAGKGVLICRDPVEATGAIHALMPVPEGCILIEECLRGPEISLLALVDGENAVALTPAQDHKRLGNGDTGPNTGGMGAYAPVPFVDSTQVTELMRITIQPVVTALAEAGTPYRGVLFAGLMLTEDGPRVLEYNCRLGDPEAQVVLPLIEGDLLPWLDAVADGRLRGPVPQRSGSAVGVVLATAGYPEAPRTGDLIQGLDASLENTLIFQAGTARNNAGETITAGGRVVTVVGLGETIDRAAERAYASPVRFARMQRRDDIAWQARTVSSNENRNIPGGPDCRPQHALHTGGVAVLASGAGSNLQALIDACEGGRLGTGIVAVISHDPSAGALERAQRAGIPAYVVGPIDRTDRQARRRMEEQILETLAPHRPGLIVLAGWMLVLSDWLLQRCACPVINVHPALLPLAGGPDTTIDVRSEGLPGEEPLPVIRGAHAVRDALEQKLPYTGVSVHRVTAAVDEGPVLRRQIVTIEETDDQMVLHRRIKAVEHRLLVDAVDDVLAPVVGGMHARSNQ